MPQLAEEWCLPLSGKLPGSRFRGIPRCRHPAKESESQWLPGMPASTGEVSPIGIGGNTSQSVALSSRANRIGRARMGFGQETEPTEPCRAKVRLEPTGRDRAKRSARSRMASILELGKLTAATLAGSRLEGLSGVGAPNRRRAFKAPATRQRLRRDSSQSPRLVFAIGLIVPAGGDAVTAAGWLWHVADLWTDA